MGDYERLEAVVGRIEGLCGRCPLRGRLEQLTAEVPTAADAPVITGIALAKAPGGTHATVTIAGRNFDEHCSVRFPRGPEAGGVAIGLRKSVTATQIVCEVPVCDSGGVVVRKGLGDGTHLDSAPYPFSVSFCHRAIDRIGAGAMPYPHLFHRAGTPDCEGEWSAVVAAFQAWERVPGCYPHSYLDGYADAVSYPQPAQHGTMGWIENGWTEKPEWIAYCYRDWMAGGGWAIWFNGQHFQFTDGHTGTGYDVQGTATHEIGHTWGLGDLYGTGDSAKTMYGYITSATSRGKRTLEPDDIAGVQYIYPGKPALAASPASLDLSYEAGTDPWPSYNPATGVIEVRNVGQGVLSTRTQVPSQYGSWLFAYTSTANGNTELIHVGAGLTVRSPTARQTAAGAEIRRLLAQDAEVTARLLNLAGRVVRTIALDRPLAAGSRVLTWDGTDDQGLRVPRGAYRRAQRGNRLPRPARVTW